MNPRIQTRGLALFVAMVLAGIDAIAAESDWARPGPDGKLIYKTTPAGDRIMDFSHAGYMGGGVALPSVGVKRTGCVHLLQARGGRQGATDGEEIPGVDDVASRLRK